MQTDYAWRKNRIFTKNRKNQQKAQNEKKSTQKIERKNTTAVHAQHVCRQQHATPPTKLQKRCQRRHTDAHKSRYKKAKSSNKNLHFNALHLFCRTQKPRSFPLSPLFRTLIACRYNAQLCRQCAGMYVCVSVSISVKIFHLQFKSMTSSPEKYATKI